MIWCDKFVVGSIPRTGTDITSYLVRDVEGVQAVPKRRHTKHDSLGRRWSPGKLACLTFRRQRPWFLSFIVLAVEDGLYPFYDEHRMPWPSADDLFSDEFGREWLGELPGPLAGLGDRYLEFMTEGWTIPVDRYLRCEFIAEDLISLLDESGCNFDADNIRKVGGIYHPSKRPLPYDKDTSKYWDDGVWERIELANPRWLEIERSLY